jgi:hypothetical protein
MLLFYNGWPDLLLPDGHPMAAPWHRTHMDEGTIFDPVKFVLFYNIPS